MTTLFPLWWIANSALTAAAVAGLVMVLWGRRFKSPDSPIDYLAVIIVVLLSVLVWRTVCNVAVLNDDPVPGFSPNDILCPLFTYLALGMLAAFRQPVEAVKWERLRVVLALVSLVVNVVTI
jgi:hypothetical protein